MGKPTGFLEYQRLSEAYAPVEARLKNYKEFVLRLSDEEAGQKFVEAIADFCERLGVPTLTGSGLPREDLIELLPRLAEDAIASGSVAMNPRVPTADEIVELYLKAL